MMNEETIVAVFDTAAHAQAAVRALQDAGIPSGDITQHSSESYSGATGATGAELAPRREEPGFWSRLFGTESDDYSRDNAVYGRTVQAGGSVVSVRVSDAGRDADRVMQILESHNPVDIEERASSYEGASTVYDTPQTTRSLGVAEAGGVFGASGMTNTAGMGTAGMGTAGMGTAGMGTAGMGTAGMGTGGLSTGSLGAGGLSDDTIATAGMSTGSRTGADGEIIPLAEEQLQIGKRVVNRGTTRVRRYVVETPVEENVTLHNESISVERRPASGANVAADAFTDKTIELTEMNEEAVVGKTARVVEEVVVHKQAGDRVETVRDTLRKEQVDVEKVADTNLRDESITGAGATRTGSGSDIDPLTGRKRTL